MAARWPAAPGSGSSGSSAPATGSQAAKWPQCVERRRHDLARLAAQLDALSPLRVLERGYAVPTDAGRPRAQARGRSSLPGAPFALRVADGRVDARVEPCMTTIAEDLARLEEIVRRLEADDVELDAALALFEEGVARLRAARERLAAADLKVQTVLEEAKGDAAAAGPGWPERGRPEPR